MSGLLGDNAQGSVSLLEASPPPRRSTSYFGPIDGCGTSSPKTRWNPSPSLGGGSYSSEDVNEDAILKPNFIYNLVQGTSQRPGAYPQITASSTALNKAPSVRDIPPVALANVPQVSPSVFQVYLSQVEDLYEGLQSVKDNLKEGRDQVNNLVSVKPPNGDLNVVSDMSPLSPGDKYRSQSDARLTYHNTHKRHWTKPHTAKRRGLQPPALTTIPDIYFEPNFHLENPRTFDIVSEKSEIIVRDGSQEVALDDDSSNISRYSLPGRKVLATNAILQEKLSWYMDTVEIHLISSISSASKSFFNALGSLKDLQHDAQKSIAQIRTLRINLARLDANMVYGGSRVAQMQRRRESVTRLITATIELQQLIQKVQTCQKAVENEEHEVALDLLDEIRKPTTGVNTAIYTSIDSITDYHGRKSLEMGLRSLRSVDQITGNISLLQKNLSRIFEQRFLDILLNDLRQKVQNTSVDEILQRWLVASQRLRGDQSRSQSLTPSFLEISPGMRTELITTLIGLKRCGSLSNAASTYREAVLKYIKGIIRSSLPSSSDDDAESVTSMSNRGGRTSTQQERSMVLARHLRALDDIAAEELLTHMCTSLGEAFRRLTIHIKLLLDVTSGNASPTVQSPRNMSRAGSVDNVHIARHITSANSIQDVITESIDMSGLLGQAVDTAQNQLIKILKVRTDQSLQLSLPQFLKYFTLNKLFVDECEAVSGRTGSAIKATVNNQISDFLSHFTDRQKQALAHCMEADKWDPCVIQEIDQMRLGSIIDAAEIDSERWTQSFNIREPEAKEEDKSLLTGNMPETKEKPNYLVIDGEEYILIKPTLVLLGTIDQFENLVVGIPSIVEEITSALIEYLKLFNSRSYQLILGAGATKSAGLKNINTKHLALASQSLAFVVALIPYLRNFLRRHTSPSSTTPMELDKLQQLYRDHQTNIQDKLVDIMTGRTAAHIKSMNKIDWNETSKSQASLYMETLTRETSTLNRVLAKHLPQQTVSSIMVPVFANYRQHWGEAFKSATVHSEAGKARLLLDAELFQSKLGKIPGAGNIGTELVNIVKSKEISNNQDEEEKQPAEDSGSVIFDASG